MKIARKQTETYVLTDLPSLDQVTVYVTNYKEGVGKIVIECFGKAWSCYWSAMGKSNIQQFFINCNNEYILNRIILETHQTDFYEIGKVLCDNGFTETCVESDVQVVEAKDDIAECFGADWRIDLPRCHTDEYKYLGRIIDAVKIAFISEGE